jgi:hypothetical protein
MNYQGRTEESRNRKATAVPMEKFGSRKIAGKRHVVYFQYDKSIIGVFDPRVPENTQASESQIVDEKSHYKGRKNDRMIYTKHKKIRRGRLLSHVAPAGRPRARVNNFYDAHPAY